MAVLYGYVSVCSHLFYTVTNKTSVKIWKYLPLVKMSLKQLHALGREFVTGTGMYLMLIYKLYNTFIENVDIIYNNSERNTFKNNFY